jgi:hypothetical protein
VVRARRGERGGGVIERYLCELRRRLPWALGARGRVLAEARDHLLEAAMRIGDERAVAEFGPADEVAARLGPELAARAAARAAAIVPVLVAAFVVPFYLVPENEFPPAPWTSVPGYLAWKHDVALGAFAAAVALALIGALLGAVRPRLAIGPLVLVAAALTVAAGFASVLDAQWIDEVPGTSATLVWGVIVPARVAVVALVWAALAAASASPTRPLASTAWPPRPPSSTSPT